MKQLTPSHPLTGSVPVIAVLMGLILLLGACSAAPAGVKATGAAASPSASPATTTPAATPTGPPLPNAALDLPVGTVTISRAGHTELTLRVQIAATEVSRDTGLMGVKSMGDQVGMAFLFDSPSTVPFWMEDTLIPLDIVFWSPVGAAVTTYTMTPCLASPCPLYTPTGPYIGAVEMNAGLLARAGIKMGDTVTLVRS
jgi:uncharacterized membrane protein (UPF0127 family)